MKQHMPDVPMSPLLKNKIKSIVLIILSLDFLQIQMSSLLFLNLRKKLLKETNNALSCGDTILFLSLFQHVKIFVEKKKKNGCQ